MDRPTEPIWSYDPSSRHDDRWLARPQRRRLPQGTVRTVVVVMIDVLGQDSLEMPASQDQHPVQCLTPNGADPALRVGVRPRRPHRCAQHLESLGGEDRVEGGGISETADSSKKTSQTDSAAAPF